MRYSTKGRMGIFVGLMLGLSLVTFTYAKGNMPPTFADVVFLQISNPTILCFSILYPFLLLMKSTDKENTPMADLKESLALSALAAGVILLVNITAYCIATGCMYGWGAVNPFATGDWEAIDFIMAFVLFFCRMTFMTMLVKLLNKRFAPFGFAGPLALSLIDWMLYDYLGVSAPWGILPIEHSTVYDTVMLGGGGARQPYINSMIYWTILICAAYGLLKLVKVKKPDAYHKTTWQGVAAAGIVIFLAALVNVLFSMQLQDIQKNLPIGFQNVFYFSAMRQEPILSCVGPMLAVLAARQTGRTRKNKPLLTANLAGGGVYLGAYVLILLCSVIVDGTSKEFLSAPIGPFQSFGLSSLGWIVAFILNACLTGCVYATLGYCIQKAFPKDRTLPYTGVLLFSALSCYNGLCIFGNPLQEIGAALLPSYPLDIVDMAKPLVDYIVQLLTPLATGLMIYEISKSQRKRKTHEHGEARALDVRTEVS